MQFSIESDRKGDGYKMLTFGEFIAVLGLCISIFMLEYRIGRDKSQDEKTLKQKHPPRSR